MDPFELLLPHSAKKDAKTAAVAEPKTTGSASSGLVEALTVGIEAWKEKALTLEKKLDAMGKTKGEKKKAKGEKKEKKEKTPTQKLEARIKKLERKKKKSKTQLLTERIKKLEKKGK